MNKYLPHLFVLPEDDANRQIANGFILSLNLDTRKIQVLNEAGGWKKVLHNFNNTHAPNMLCRLPSLVPTRRRFRQHR